MSAAILGNGIYGFAEAARLIGARPSRVRAWFRGWPYGAAAFAHSDYELVESRSGIMSFLDLVDALFVFKLRQAGVSLQYLRKVHEALKAEFRAEHPFSRNRIFTDGRHIFLEKADETGGARLIELVSRLLRQDAMPPILEPYLKRIDYDPVSFLARRWNIYEGVAIDPQRSYGKPIVDAVGISTAVLAAAHRANGMDADVVAEWYEIKPKHVMTAVAFENQFAQRAA